MNELRPYQSSAVAEVLARLRSGQRAVALCSPAGSGKSTAGAAIAAAHCETGGTVLALAHRRELLAQLEETFLSRGVPRASLRLESVQGLLASGARPHASLVVWDEFHHALAPQWRDVATHYLEAGHVPALVGLSATPMRPSGEALGTLFQSMVVAASVRQLTALGYLVPSRVVAPGDTVRAMAETPLQAWLRWAPGQSTIVFCRDVKHAKDVAATFRAAGVTAECVEGNMRAEARADAFARFIAGTLTVLTNVQIATEGTDLPRCSCVILAAGTSHDGAWLQKVGRGGRLFPGKSEYIVIDLLGAVYMRGMPDAEREFSLSGRAITTRDLGPEVAIRQCPVCFMVAEVRQFEAGHCPYCNAPRKARKDPRVIRATLARVREGHVDAVRVRSLAGWVRTCVIEGRAKRLAKGHGAAHADRLGMLQAGHLYRKAYGVEATAAQLGEAVRMVKAEIEERGRQLILGETE